MRLAEARLYLVAPAQLRAGPLSKLVPELVAAGVDMVQLREKELEAGDVLRLAEPIADACAGAGIPFIVNDRPDIALTLGRSGVHVGQDDLPPAAARRILGADAIVGLSTHSTEDIDEVPPEVDYIAVGPVFETPTKPGRPAVGMELLEHAATVTPLPWFAIGGIDVSNIVGVLDAGARRVVVVRALTQVKDPITAAGQLKEILRSAGSP